MKAQFGLLIFTFLIALISVIFRDTLYSTLKRASALPAVVREIPFSPLKAPHIPVKSDNMSVLRAIRKTFVAIEQSEGAGARVRRSIGGMHLRNFTPFLMLDHFSTTSLAGFPDHPHRGQGKCHIQLPYVSVYAHNKNIETITYLLNGEIDHEDFVGNKGTIRTGGLQFMTAGRGIMHAEMPRTPPDGSPNIGIQLWVDLPEKLKTCEPRYRDLDPSEIPNVDVDDGKVHVKVISGKSHGVDSVKELAYTPVWLLDIKIKPGGKIVQDIPVGWNAFAYVLSGSAAFKDENETKTVGQYSTVVFQQEGDGVAIEVDSAAKEDGHIRE
jgi:redox-sensitive bicupin YhaK (pirin superfamily)